MADPCTTSSMDVPAAALVESYDGLTFHGVIKAACTPRDHLCEPCRQSPPPPPPPPSIALASTSLQHMMAGAMAGIGEHIAMFPVDTVKTRMQALAHPGQQASKDHRRSLRARKNVVTIFTPMPMRLLPFLTRSCTPALALHCETFCGGRASRACTEA